MSPQFEKEYSDFVFFRTTRTEELAEKFHNIINRSARSGTLGTDFYPRGGHYEHVHIATQALAHRYFSGTFSELAKLGHEDFLQGYADQSSIMLSGKYEEYGAVLVSRLRNLTSVTLCGGEGALEDHVHDLPDRAPTFLEKRYPRIGLGLLPVIKIPSSCYTFPSSVLRLLNLAQIRPLELTMIHKAVITPAQNQGRSSRCVVKSLLGRLAAA